MIHQEDKTATAVQQNTDSPRYDSRSLASALATLSRSEIESMLGHIAGLETRITKLNVSGQEDEMMHLVTDGLSRLTYFLDAVKRYKDEIGDGN